VGAAGQEPALGRPQPGKVWNFSVSNAIINVMNVTDRYRLEALLELASVYPGALAAAEIARRRSIPASFLRRLLAELVRSGVVAASRGRQGGVRLAQGPEEVRLEVLLPERSAPSTSPAIAWLEGRLQAQRREVLQAVSLATLLEVERRQLAAGDWQI